MAESAAIHNWQRSVQPPSRAQPAGNLIQRWFSQTSATGWAECVPTLGRGRFQRCASPACEIRHLEPRRARPRSHWLSSPRPVAGLRSAHQAFTSLCGKAARNVVATCRKGFRRIRTTPHFGRRPFQPARAVFHDILIRAFFSFKNNALARFLPALIEMFHGNRGLQRNLLLLSKHGSHN